MTIKVTNAKWEQGKLPSDFSITLPKDTPSWCILQSINDECLKKYGEHPWTYKISIVKQ